MIILLTVLCVLAVTVASISNVYEHEVINFLSLLGAVAIGVAEVIIIAVIIAFMANGITASEKIKMYQTENKKIENQIGELVKGYMDYESETYKSFKNESSITMVNLYPDLKSNELVQKQMNIYLTNNDKIKELNEKEIDTKIGKWLLYFGN